MKRTVLALPFALALAACVEADPEELGVAEQNAGCSAWGCGSNSPILGPLYFHELKESGTSLEGIGIVDMVQNNVHYRVHVHADKLYGISLNGGPNLSGAALDGARINLTTPAGNATLYIENVNTASQKFWRGPATYVETYELRYTGAGVPNFGAPLPLCQNPPGRRDGEGSYWLEQYEAILFTGDRYNASSKTVTATTPAQSGDYFNIACAGGALAKLHLNRYTYAGSTSGYTSGGATRQAMLKMYTGDFCGTGVAYTRQGVTLRWTNAQLQTSAGGSTASNEALWDLNGAKCIKVHRLHGSAYDMDSTIACAPWNGGSLRACNASDFTSFSSSGAAFMTQSAALP